MKMMTEFPTFKCGVLLLLLLLIFILIPSITLAQTFTESALKDGIGIRPLSMGGAFTAVADDMNTIFYNPGGLDNLPLVGYSYGGMDLNNEESLVNSYSYFNLGPLGYAGWKRRNLTGEEMEVNTYGFGRRGGAIGWGLSYKNIRSDSSPGWSSDVGLLLYLTPYLNLGLLAQDVAQDKFTPVTYATRVGLAWTPWDFLLLATDAEFRSSGILMHYGAETQIAKGFKLRLGSDRGKFTAGAGFELPIFTLNYALLADPDLPRTIHRFGVEMGLWGKPKRSISLIKPKEFALIQVGGSLKGGEGEFSLLGGTRSGADVILRNIRRAIKDPGIDGIVLKLKGFEGGLGSPGIVQELRTELKRAKAKGKKVVVYIESSALGDEYYLASVADRVIAPPQAMVGGIGRAVGVGRIRELFNKIGIEWQIISKGKYKEAFGAFSPGLTPEQKQMVSSIVADRYRQMLNDIAGEREIEMEKLKEVADGRLFTAQEAKEIKLIDEIGYFKKAVLEGAKLLGTKEEPGLISPELLKEEEEDFLLPIFPKIAVIQVDGEIVTGRSGEDIIFGGRYTGADTICEQIEEAREDWQVKAIILRVNSPGGSAIASGQIWKELQKAREEGKVVITSMGDVAASGGYYVGSAADKVIANPGTITGGIGVVGMVPVLSELYKKIGVEYEMFKEGKHADMFSGLRKLTPEERESLSHIMENTYQEFIGAVAQGRGMGTEEVAAVAEGRVYTGSQALEANLVDELGNFTDAVERAKKEANIKGEARLVYYREGGFYITIGIGGGEVLKIFPKSPLEWTEYRLPGF